MRQINF
jgi:AP2-associated kinase